MPDTNEAYTKNHFKQGKITEINPKKQSLYSLLGVYTFI